MSHWYLLTSEIKSIKSIKRPSKRLAGQNEMDQKTELAAE